MPFKCDLQRYIEVIRDPRKRAAEMYRRAEIAAKNHQGATMRKFEAENARVDLARAKLNLKNVERRISIELERHALGGGLYNKLSRMQL